MTATSFSPEESRVEQPLLSEGWPKSRIMKRRFVHTLRGREVHIVADEIHQLERSHPEATNLFHGPIDRRHVGNAFFVNPQSFAVEGPCNAIDYESASIRRDDRLFSPGIHELSRRINDILRRRETGNDLHEWENRRWVEKMNSHNAFRTRG